MLRLSAARIYLTATASNADGLSASATCTTNFTVVAVDVQIGSVGEDKEEMEEAFVQYVKDATGSAWTVDLVGIGKCNNPFFENLRYDPYTNAVEGVDRIE